MFLDSRIRKIANERLAENGFRAELQFYKNFCAKFSQTIDECIVAFESEERAKQHSTCKAIRDSFEELDTMRAMFDILLENPTVCKNCFAYSFGRCNVLTELICKTRTCDFFKTVEEYRRGF